MFSALIYGLEDYTVSERGDVGSWIRIACIRALTSISRFLISNTASIPNFAEYLPAESYQRAVGGILKQGVERLDNVRQQAGENFLLLLKLSTPIVPNGERWEIRNRALFEELFAG